MKLRTPMILLAVVIRIAVAQAQTVPDAIVVSMRGEALVRSGKDGGPRRIRKGDKLFSGQQVKCDRGCQDLKISYCNITRPIIHGPRWTTILSINCRAAEYPRGGAPKGTRISIISPREAEVVQPETFSLKWRQYKQQSKINVYLKIDLGEEIWSEKNIAGDATHFESDSLREKLKEAQTAGELDLILVLNVVNGKEPDQVKFRLISLGDQRALSKRLEAFANEPDEALRHIGRGLKFSEYELYAEAVPELEKALSVLRAQDADLSSVNGLIRLLIMTQYQAYNDDRVRQLCLTMRKSSSLPMACAEGRK